MSEANSVQRGVGRPYPKRADWKHDVHAYECYTCDQRGAAPRGNAHCTGCINRPTRPHWKPHPDYAAEAQRVILLACGKTPNTTDDRPSVRSITELG